MSLLGAGQILSNAGPLAERNLRSGIAYPWHMSSSRSAAEIAEQAGIDLALSLDNLRLSYDERARRHQTALDLALALEEAGKALRERSAGAARQAG